ncbi:MAG: hypothetical protein JXP73_00595 [Deltaproteobacteria bacterium]|nr:hypothetical protein [Deltaproteobacteria bacterium]
MLRVRHLRRPSRLLWLCASATMALLVEPPGFAGAAETDLYVRLHYAVDAAVRGCWDELEFRRSVARRIGYDPFREDASLDVHVHVGGTANAVDGHVEWRKANGLLMGERRFVAKDGNCVKLLTELSFAVGLQIELLRPKTPSGAGAVASARGGGATASGAAPIAATVTAPPPSVAPPATPPPPTPVSPPSAAPPEAAPPAAAPEPVVTEEPSPRRRRFDKTADESEPKSAETALRWPMWIGLGPSLAWRLSPAITADARLFVGIRRNALSLEVAAEASYPSTQRSRDGSGFRQTLIGGTLALCGHRQWLAACALGRASQIRVTGLGVDEPRSPTGLAAQAGLRVAAALDLGGPWFLAAHLDGLGLLTSCTVMLNGAAVWEMPRLGALLGIDLAARFR